METVERDFAEKGVAFFYIYKALAHPELNGYVSPFTLEERLMHVKEAERTLGSRIPWICDTMENDLKHAFGDAPNSEFVIGPDGKVLRRRGWSNPSQLRRDLEELIGPIERPTQITDLDMKTEPPMERVATGIVPRPALPTQMVPLKVRPVFDDSKTPFYVKLRAEAANSLLRRGEGKLYLGFHLDPLYRVHWNNLTDPLEFEINSRSERSVSPDSGKGPKVNEPADSDPREFVLDVSGAEIAGTQFDVTVRYFACDNANTFCIPVTQRYVVSLEQDRDGGRARRGDRGRLGPMRRFVEMDENSDGKLTRDEARGRMAARFDRMDSNGDRIVDRAEMEAMIRRGRGGGRRPGR